MAQTINISKLDIDITVTTDVFYDCDPNIRMEFWNWTRESS